MFENETFHQKRAYEIFNEMLKINDPEQRHEFLREACENRDLLDEVMAMLQIADAPTITEKIDEATPNFWVGQHVGRYLIKEKIGEGGFGEVFVARHPDTPADLVALKMLKAGMDSEEVLSRFRIEQQALAMMDHPGIAKSLGTGITESGQPYFVMELIKGAAITDFSDQKGLNLEQRIEIFIDVCEAIQHAHQKGVIHRDIKSFNILVTNDDSRIQPKVIDFGVATAITPRLNRHPRDTRLSSVVGTPMYMSPEQAGRNQQDVDTRSDIYSLGVVLYELLTGTTPMTHAESENLAFDEILNHIRESDPPKPSDRIREPEQSIAELAQRRSTDPSRLSRSMSGDLDLIVMKALEKDRDRRYDSPGSFADDLRRFLQNEVIQARPPSACYRIRKFCQKNKVSVCTAALMAAILVITSIISVWQAFSETWATQQAQQSEQKTRKLLETEKSARKRESDLRKQAEQNALDLIPILSSRRDRKSFEVLQRLDRRTGQLESTPTTMEIRWQLADAQERFGNVERSEEILRELLNNQEQQYGRTDMHCILTVIEIARHLSGEQGKQYRQRKLTAITDEFGTDNYRCIPFFLASQDFESKLRAYEISLKKDDSIPEKFELYLKNRPFESVTSACRNGFIEKAISDQRVKSVEDLLARQQKSSEWLVKFYFAIILNNSDYDFALELNRRLVRILEKAGDSKRYQLLYARAQVGFILNQKLYNYYRSGIGYSGPIAADAEARLAEASLVTSFDALWEMRENIPIQSRSATIYNTALNLALTYRFRQMPDKRTEWTRRIDDIKNQPWYRQSVDLPVFANSRILSDRTRKRIHGR